MPDDRDFAFLLDALGLSWPGYRKVWKGVKKRLTRFMMERGFDNISDLIENLGGDPALAAACKAHLNVTISRFYRDPWVWQVLRYEILPNLAHLEKVCAWSAGCASGEEPYTLAIVWREMLKGTNQPPSLNIVATDLDKKCLARSAEGVFPASSLRQLPEPWRARWFNSYTDNKTWRINEELSRGIQWRAHDFLVEPPPGSFHLVFLRNNLLTYLKEERRRDALLGILRGLVPGGWLLIGRGESLPAGLPWLRPHNACPLALRNQRRMCEVSSLAVGSIGLSALSPWA